MANHYIDAVHGDDVAGDGSEGNPYKTLAKGESMSIAGDWLMVQDGIYAELLYLDHALNVRGLGSSVWIDGGYVRNGIQMHFNGPCMFQNLKLKNFTQYAFFDSRNLGGCAWAWNAIFMNCLITDDNPSRRTITAFYSMHNYPTDKFLIINCHIERVAKVSKVYFTGGNITIRNTILREYTTLYSDKIPTFQKVGYPGAGASNIDITALPPPYRDAANFNYSIDPAGANWMSYIGAGWHDGDVGTQAGRAHSFITECPETDFDGGTGVSAWINDARCYDIAFPPITIDATNDKGDFREGGGELTAILAHATYNDGPTLSAAIKAAMELAGASVYTISLLTYKHLRIATGGAALDLLCSTGTNVATSFWSAIGYSLVSDKIGALTYDGDYAITVGASTAVGEGLELAITAALGHNKLDFDEGGLELNATVADVTSNDPVVIAAAVKTALETVGGDTYTITHDGDGIRSRRYRVTKDGGGVFNFLNGTGTNAANSCCLILGFSAIDKGGATSYLADRAVSSGPVAVDGTGREAFDFAVQPDARLGRALTPVLDKGAGTPEWRNLEWSELDDVGQKRYVNADNLVETVLTRGVEARANGSTFLQDAADTGLAHDFMQVNRGDVLNWEERYLQVRVSFREVV